MYVYMYVCVLRSSLVIEGGGPRGGRGELRRVSLLCLRT
jgi:hypothetical protein